MTAKERLKALVPVLIFFAVLLTIMHLFEDNTVRLFTGFFPILLIIVSLAYSKFQSEMKIISLVIRNIFKSSTNKKLYLTSYWRDLLETFILLIFLVAVSYKITMILSPILVMPPEKDLTKILIALISMGTLYSVAFYFLIMKNFIKLSSERKTALGEVILIMLLGTSFYYGIKPLIITVGVEIAALSWLTKKFCRR